MGKRSELLTLLTPRGPPSRGSRRDRFPGRLPDSRGVTLHPGAGLCPTGPEASRGDRLVSAQLGPGLEPFPVAAPAICKGRRGPGAVGGIRPLAQARLSREVGAGDPLAHVLSTQALDVSTKACFVVLFVWNLVFGPRSAGFVTPLPHCRV